MRAELSFAAKLVAFHVRVMRRLSLYKILQVPCFNMVPSGTLRMEV